MPGSSSRPKPDGVTPQAPRQPPPLPSTYPSNGTHQSSMRPPPKLVPQPSPSSNRQPNLYGLGSEAQPPPYSLKTTDEETGPRTPTNTSSRTEHRSSTEANGERHWGYVFFGFMFGFFFLFFGFLGLLCINFPRPRRSYAMGCGVGLVLAIVTYFIVGFAVSSWYTTL